VVFVVLDSIDLEFVLVFHQPKVLHLLIIEHNALYSYQIYILNLPYNLYIFYYFYCAGVTVDELATADCCAFCFCCNAVATALIFPDKNC